MANTNNTIDPLEHIMVHPALRKATDLIPAEPWISAMASINDLVSDGMTKGLLLVFKGEADGVRRYNGYVSTGSMHSAYVLADFLEDELWDTEGDCQVRLDNQDVYFDSNIIFGTKSQYLISLISGKHSIGHLWTVQTLITHQNVFARRVDTISSKCLHSAKIWKRSTNTTSPFATSSQPSSANPSSDVLWYLL